MRDLVLFYLVAIFSIRMVPLAASIGPSVLVLWLVALVVFYLPLALSVSALARRLPGEGGVYLWSKAAFGDFHGFLTAWTYWTTNLVFFPSTLLFAASQMASVTPDPAPWVASRTFLTGFSVTVMVAVFLLHWLGLDVATRLHNLSAAARFALVALVVGLGAASWIRFGSATDLAWGSWVPRLADVKDLVFLSTLAYMFAGAESAAVLGDEVREPRRTLPRAIAASGAVIAGLYVVSSLALMVSLPRTELTGLAGFTDAVAAAAGRLTSASAAAGATATAALLLMVMAIGSVSVWFAAAARLPFVVGLDRYLPPSFGRLDRRFGTPVVALGSLATATVLFVLLSGLGGRAEQVYSVLVSLEIVIYFIPYLYLFAALLRLSLGRSRGEAPLVAGRRAWTWLVGGVGLVVTAGSLVLALIPGEDVASPRAFYLTVLGSLGGNLATGAALYWYGRRRRRTDATAS